MNRTVRACLGIFFVMVIAVSAISICRNLGKQMKWDFTEHRLYTLSDGTRDILTGLKQPITLKLFYSKKATEKASDEIRYYNNYYRYVKSLLEEYQRQAKGNIVLEVIDPRPYSDEELAAIRYRLRRFNITEKESFFFGLVLETPFGVTKTIEFFLPDRQQFVEYDISYLIDTAVTRQKTRLGVLSSLPVMGDSEYMLQMRRLQNQQGNRKWGIIAHLEEKYDVSSVPTETDEIADVDLLLVIHPKKLPEKTLFAIDQFVLKGGRAVVCVDPHCVADKPDMQQQYQGVQHESNSNMPRLLRAWGLTMPNFTFVGDRRLALKRSMSQNTPPETDISLLAFNAAYNCFNADNAITGQLQKDVRVFFAGSLERFELKEEDRPDLEYVPLLFTSDKGNVWKAESYELGTRDFSGFLRRFQDGEEPVVLSYLITGNFKTAFPDGIEVPADVPAENGAPEPVVNKVTGLTESAQPGAVVVVSDADMLSDMLAYDARLYYGYGILNPLEDNSAFVLNALGNLAGSDRLISIRSRGNYERPFTVVKDIEMAAEARTIEKKRIIEEKVKILREEYMKLRAPQDGDDELLVTQENLQKERDIDLKLHNMEKDLWDIMGKEREDVEQIKGRMLFYCTVPGPIFVLMIAVGLWVYRGIKRRYYISHASDS